jgi:colanic acid/amylovoran biosynthesis protein
MNILIVNVHSALNLGDDAIMHSTVQALNDKYPSANITVAANDPLSWKKFAQVEVVSSLCSWVADCRLGLWRSRLYRMPFYLIVLLVLIVAFRLFKLELTTPDPEKKRLLNAYYKADVVISCGGGNFYAHHKASPSLFWALATIAFAIGLGKKVIMLPQSIGPIEGGLQRRMARAVIGRVRMIMVREPVSLDFVRRTLKIDKSKSIVLPDLAFGLSESPAFEKRALSNNEESLSVGITIINRAEQNIEFDRQSIYEDAITAAATKLAKEYGAHVYLYVQCYGPSPDQDDRHVTGRLYSRILEHTDQVSILDSFDDAREIRASLKGMDCIMATRMHTAIFALINDTPLVLIGYQPKSRGLMDSLNLSKYYCDIDEVSPELLMDMVEDAVANRVSLKQHIAGEMEQIRPTVSSWTDQITG